MSSDPVAALPMDRPRVLPPSLSSAVSDLAPPAGRMGWAWRFCFRFGALYLGLFLIGRVLGLVPGLGWFSGQYFQFWRKIVPWFGREVLRLGQPVSLAPSGSGDKLFDWVQVAAMLSFAFVGASIWVWFDRARKADGAVRELVRIALRYALGATMLSYGISKVLHEQMPAPGMFRLLQPYGESSPMGLLWTFMGQSWAYSAFAGGLECVGGLLLFFRRTTTLGALLIAIVMTNVLLMNLTFDVPVKLYSAHYLIFAIILAAPDAGRLWRVLVLHRPTQPESIARPWPVGRAGRGMTVVKALMVIGVLWQVPVQRIWRWAEQPAPVKSAYYGVYEVEGFARDGTERPPLTTDTLRWRRVGIDEQNRGTVLLMNDARMGFRLAPGPGPGKITLEFPAGRTPRREVFKVTRGAADQLLLEGRMNQSDYAIRLRRSDDSKLRLRERGFHWISEQPFNR